MYFILESFTIYVQRSRASRASKTRATVLHFRESKKREELSGEDSRSLLEIFFDLYVYHYIFAGGSNY